MFCDIKKETWFILISVFILAFLLNIEYSAVNLILVPISKDFNEDLNILQWLLSGYTLAWAATALIGGRLSDIYGSKRLFFIGVWVFCIACLICGCARSTWVLISGRIIQGVGGGLFVAPLYSILFLETPEKKRGFTMGLLGIFCGIGLAFGPSIGGGLLKLLSWHWVFLINIPLCLGAMWLMYTFASEKNQPSSKKTVDIPGSALLAFSIVLLLFTLNQSEVWGVTSPHFLLFITISVILFFCFFKHQKHKKDKIIPPDLFHNIPYIGCFVGVSLFEYVFSSTLLLVNLYLQNVLHYSAYESGIIFLSMTLSFAIFSLIGGKMCDIMDGRIPLCGGMILSGISIVWMSSFTPQTELSFITYALMLLGCGQGLSFPCLNAIMLKTIPPSTINTASGLFSVGICLFLSIGVVVSSSLLTGLGQAYLFQILPKNTLTSHEISSLMSYIAAAHHNVTELYHIANFEYLNTLVERAYMSGLRATILISATVSFFSAAFCFLTIKNIKTQQTS